MNEKLGGVAVDTVKLILPVAVAAPALAENGIVAVPAARELLAWKVTLEPAAGRVSGNEVTAEIPVGGVTPVRLVAAVMLTVDGVNFAMNELPGKIFAAFGVAQITSVGGVDVGR